MNKISNKISILIGMFLLLITYSCQDEVFNDIQVSAPQNLVINVDISTDESGTVTVKPQAEGASYFDIYYGEGNPEATQTVQAGDVGSHVYTEGNYTIKVLAYNLKGDHIEATEDISLSFLAPENLVIDVTIDPINTNVVTVKPTADFATLYDIYYGDVTDEEPSQIMAGAVGLHTYSESGTYQIRVVAKSASATTLEGTVDVSIELPAKQLSLPIDFEDSELTYEFVSFGNANVFKDSNPDKSGINTSDNVAKFIKAAGAETWAGGTIQLPAPIDFSENDQFNIKVWSPKSGANVLLKIENALDGEIFFEKQVTTTTANSWENLVFDMSGADKSNEYHKIVIFMDFGVVGDNSEFFFDDISLGEGGGNGGGDDQIELPLDFESATIDYSFTDFGNATTSIIANPDASGENTSANVAQFNKGAGAETWAGSFVTLSAPIDFSQGTTFEIKSWSPKSGINILMKLENLDDGDVAHEIQISNTVADQWETLSFDFSSIDMSKTYQKIVIFYDFGVAGDDTNYYFDDIILK